MNHCSYCCLYSHNLVHHCCVCQCPYHSTLQCPLLSGQTKVNCCGNNSKSLCRNKDEECSTSDKNETEDLCLEDDVSVECTQLKTEFTKCPKNTSSPKVEESERKNNGCAHGVLSCCNLCCSGVIDGKSYCCKQCAVQLLETYEKCSVKKKPCQEKLSDFAKNDCANEHLDSPCDLKCNDEKEDIIDCNICPTMSSKRKEPIDCNICPTMSSKRKEPVTKQNKQDILVGCDCKMNLQREQLLSNKFNSLGLPVDYSHKHPKRTYLTFQDSPEKKIIKENPEYDPYNLSPPKHRRSFDDPLPKHQHLFDDPLPKHQHLYDDPLPKHQHLYDDPLPKHQHLYDDPLPKHQHSFDDPLPKYHRTFDEPPKHHHHYSFNEQSKEKPPVDCPICKKAQTHKKSYDMQGKEESTVECDTCKLYLQKYQHSCDEQGKVKTLEECYDCKMICTPKKTCDKQDKEEICVECDTCKMIQLKCQSSQHKNMKKEICVECDTCKMIQLKCQSSQHKNMKKEILIDCNNCKMIEPQHETCSEKANEQDVIAECNSCKISKLTKCPEKVYIHQVFNDSKKNVNECGKCDVKNLICYEIPTKEITTDCETTTLAKPEIVQIFDCTKDVGNKLIECKSCNLKGSKCSDSNETKGIECIGVIDFKCNDCKEIIIKCNNCMMKRQISNQYLENNKKPEKKKGSFFGCCNNPKKRNRRSNSKKRS